MPGVLALILFLFFGVCTAWRLFDRVGRQTRIFLGMALGLVEMMWLPSLLAFTMTFSVKAQIYALGESALIALLCWAIPKRARRPGQKRLSEPPVALTLWLVLPFLVLSGYLQWTHMFRPIDGALTVGQSTYGDLCLHAGIATGLRNTVFPPEYTLMPGTMLGYPFLFDAASATMLMLGSYLQTALILPGTIAMGLVYWGFVLLAWSLTRDKRAVVFSYLLVFLNGGLGFFYVLKGAPNDWTKLQEVFTEFYRTPTNMPDLNLRWVNVICDLMIPQRTLVAGWVMVIAALYMLVNALKTRDLFWFIILGIWAGLMPMVHTHSFLALGLISLGTMVCVLICFPDDRRRLISGFAAYGCIAVILSAPQLLAWTFPQTLNGGALRLWFNWVNNTGQGLIDNYFWFWIKNVGLVYLLMIPAAYLAPKRCRPLCVGALVLYIVADLVLFQRNEYDNNKLFYVAFLLMMPLVGRVLSMAWERIQWKWVRGVAFALFFAVSLTSGAMSIGREVVSRYEIFDQSAVNAAAYVNANEPGDVVFLTGMQHNNPITTLCGKKIVCGTGIYLFFHGVDYDQREADVRAMYERPAESAELFAQYDVRYVYVSSYELNDFKVDRKTFEEKFPLWYQDRFVTIYEVL